MPICLVGDPDDLSGAYLRWRAERRGLEVLTLPEDLLGETWSFGLDADGLGRITVNERSIAFDHVDGAIVRLNPKPALPSDVELTDAEMSVFIVERRHGLHWLLDTAPFPVCNRPKGGRSNGSKPYHMGILALAGFQVPRWLVTNQAAAVNRFVAASPDGAIYKACSGLRSHVRRVDAALEDDLAKGTAPVLVQDYIPGNDVRVHVVADRVFPVEVISDAVDYRFDEADAAYSAIDLPERLTEECVAFAADQDLLLAGFDFRRTSQGEWYCLEVNPVPTFLPYEIATGARIADAVLDQFVGASARQARA
jgi:glutathione synthase/RimK-type ligase-like ATP-grasp enzyme